MAEGSARPRKGLLVVAGVLIVGGLIAVLVMTGRSNTSRDLGRGLHVQSLDVECPDLKLGIRDLRVVPQNGFTGWEYYLICAEPAGCNARVRLTFRFVAGGRSGELTVVRSIRLARGQTLHDGVLQRPAAAVSRVTRVEARVLAPGAANVVATPLPW
ncbi:MAG: hypothetical protein GXP47_13395 [Acidobacteria bacterium]|nr:hypothetical protein [Acidobacteriota bacterium]